MLHLIPHQALVVAASAVLAVVDTDQIGQAIIASIIIVGSVVTWWQARKAKAKVQEIHVLVNSQHDEMAKRILALEEKLDLTPGQDIPSQQTVTPATVPAS
jgi:hypothetical protein